jgi:hypothetical protein
MSTVPFSYMVQEQLITHLLQEIVFVIFSFYFPVFAYWNRTEKNLIYTYREIRYYSGVSGILENMEWKVFNI